MGTLQSTIFIEFDVNTKKITFLRGDNIINCDSNITNIYVRVKYKNLSGNTVYLTPSELEGYKFSLYTIKPATNNINMIIGEVTDELKENVYGGIVKFEIPRACTNRLGIVKCEIHINQGNKVIGSSTFVLDVQQSLVMAFDDELLDDEDFPVLKQLVLEIQKASNIDDSNRSKITTYSSDKIEDIKTNLSSQIKEKASKQEVEVERKRIDSFVALAEGSTTGDAELIDARIGADGVTYDNLGSGIRTQFNKVDEKINDIASLEEKKLTLIKGHYISNNGIKQPLSNAYISDVLLIKGGNKITFYAKGVDTNVAILAECDSAGSNIKPLICSVNSELSKFEYDFENDTYVIISSMTQDIVLRIYNNTQIKAQFNKIDEKINDISSLEEINLTLTKGHYISRYGIKQPLSSAYISDVLLIKGGNKISFYAKGIDDNIAILVECDNEGNNIKPLICSSNSDLVKFEHCFNEDTYIIISSMTQNVALRIYHNAETLVYNIEKNFNWIDGCYISSSTGNQITNDKYISTDYIKIIFAKTLEVYTVITEDYVGYAFYDADKNFISGGTGNKTILLSVPNNAVYFRCSIRTNYPKTSFGIKAYYTTQSMFSVLNDFVPYETVKKNSFNEFWKYALDNVICVGDSLTQGVYYVRDSNGEVIKQSYPYYLGRILNCDVKNTGKGGYTTQQWYNAYNSLLTEKHNVMILWLGTNGGLTDTLDVDVNAFDNYSNYADTNTGCYCKIIEKFKENNPDSFIILVKPFTSPNINTTNSVIDGIAEKYGLNVFNTSFLETWKTPQFHGGISNLHLGKVGNIYFTKELIKFITNLFDENPLMGEFGIEN